MVEIRPWQQRGTGVSRWAGGEGGVGPRHCLVASVWDHVGLRAPDITMYVCLSGLCAMSRRAGTTGVTTARQAAASLEGMGPRGGQSLAPVSVSACDRTHRRVGPGPGHSRWASYSGSPLVAGLSWWVADCWEEGGNSGGTGRWGSSVQGAWVANPSN
jgi:hypothetical protein